MTQSNMTAHEHNIADYFGDNVDALLYPTMAMDPDSAEAYRAYERFWRYEARRFGKLLVDQTVLSLGTGTAADEVYFREQGIGYVGIDISEKVLQGAITRTPRPTVARMNMRNLAFADNSFGGVWAFDSSSYVTADHMGEVLDEAHRVLKPDGSLYMSVMVGRGAMGGVQYWQPDVFEQTLRQHDFRVINARPDNGMGAAAFIAQPVQPE